MNLTSVSILTLDSYVLQNLNYLSQRTRTPNRRIITQDTMTAELGLAIVGVIDLGLKYDKPPFVYHQDNES